MPKTKHQRDKERWLREFRADVHKRLKFKPNPKEMKQACDIALKWARKGKSPSEMAEKACAGKLTNPPKKWHKKQARKYKKRLAADTREGHDAADYWQGAASAETAALAWHRNPKVKGYGQVSKRWKAGYDAARKDARRGIPPKRETSWGDKGYAGGYTVGYTEERQRQWGKVMRGAGYRFNPSREYHQLARDIYNDRAVAAELQAHSTPGKYEQFLHWEGAATAEERALGQDPREHYGELSDGERSVLRKARMRRNPDNRRPWYWECEECGFITPRSPRSKARDLGPCCRCGSTAWRKGTRAKSPGGGRPEMRRNPLMMIMENPGEFFPEALLSVVDMAPGNTDYAKWHGLTEDQIVNLYNLAMQDRLWGSSKKLRAKINRYAAHHGGTVKHAWHKFSASEIGEILNDARYEVAHSIRVRKNPGRRRMRRNSVDVESEDERRWEEYQDRLEAQARSELANKYGKHATIFVHEDGSLEVYPSKGSRSAVNIPGYAEPYVPYEGNPRRRVAGNSRRSRMRRNYPAPRILTDVTTENYFDVADGLYWFCMEWHSGQGSRLYAVGSNLGFRPAPSARGPEGETAREVYDELNQMAETNYKDAEDEAERLARAVKRSYVMTSNPRRRGARRPRVRRRR